MLPSMTATAVERTTTIVVAVEAKETAVGMMVPRVESIKSLKQQKDRERLFKRSKIPKPNLLSKRRKPKKKLSSNNPKLNLKLKPNLSLLSKLPRQKLNLLPKLVVGVTLLSVEVPLPSLASQSLFLKSVDRNQLAGNNNKPKLLKHHHQAATAPVDNAQLFPTSTRCALVNPSKSSSTFLLLSLWLSGTPIAYSKSSRLSVEKWKPLSDHSSAQDRASTFSKSLKNHASLRLFLKVRSKKSTSIKTRK